MNENFANAADEPVDDDGALHLQAGVPLDLAGLRFDQALAELFPEYSRSRLAGWIKAGDATIDGRAARPRDIVRGGETVRIATRIEAATDAQPEPIALDVLYEDADLLIVDKPAGLVVHPGAGNHTGTLVNALLHRDPALAQLPRAGIVHRLDKDTSGALVVARTLPAHTALVAMLSARDIHRQYDAIALGELVAGGTIDQPIDRHPADRLKMAVVEDGRPAVTHYRLRERYRAHTRLQVQLETGRTHQIRVHLTHLRHPLIGDPVYGGGLKLPKGCTPALADALRGFRRQALHAEKLAFDHPLRGGEVVAEAPLPADMAELIAALRADAQTA